MRTGIPPLGMSGCEAFQAHPGIRSECINEIRRIRSSEARRTKGNRVAFL